MRRAMMNHRPAVVLPTLEDVHLITAARPVKSAGTVFGFPKEIRAWLKIDPLAVAIAVRPNLWPRILLPYKRIVARDAPVIVQPQGLAAERIQLLSDLSISRIAGSDIEF